MPKYNVNTEELKESAYGLTPCLLENSPGFNDLRYFCSQACRDHVEKQSPIRFERRAARSYPTGELCAECGKKLESLEARAHRLEDWGKSVSEVLARANKYAEDFERAQISFCEDVLVEMFSPEESGVDGDFSFGEGLQCLKGDSLTAHFPDLIHRRALEDLGRFERNG